MKVSVNQKAAEIVERIVKNSRQLNCTVERLANGTTVIDAGAEVEGSTELGRLIGEVCMGGEGSVRLSQMHISDQTLPAVVVGTLNPVVACLGSQYAGWALKLEDYFAMGSGPARALVRNEKIFDEINYSDNSTVGVIVLETRQMPNENVTDFIADKCGIEPSGLYCIVVPTASVAGSVQISARIVEVALHKLHTLKFGLENVIMGHGVAPIAPVAKKDSRAMGVTNDCILYGGRVFLFVTGDDDDLKTLVEKVPSSTSEQYGVPFYKLFKSMDFDFYKIDPLLFSPAEITFVNTATGKVFRAGTLNAEVLRESFDTYT